MLLSTQIYIIEDGRWLMLLRNRKQADINHDKWIAVGGKKESGESIEECAKREAFEETGLTCESLDYKGRVLFEYDENGPEMIYIYTCESFHGELHECDEGTLAWIRQQELMNLSLWEGDRIFLERMLRDEVPFDLIFHYDSKGNLVSVSEERKLV